MFRLKGFENLRAIGHGADEVACSKSPLHQSGRRAFYALVAAGVMAAATILLPGRAGGGAAQPQQNNQPPNPGSSPPRIEFSSRRALAGSDAGNANNIFNSWVINAHSAGATALTKLTAVAANSFAPVWSPDGSQIAFQSAAALDGSDAASANMTANIWTVKSDGSGATPLTRITDSNAGGFLPAWSPNGSEIGFDSSRALDGSSSTNVNQTSNVWIVNADGSGAKPLTVLTASHADCFLGAWSPDGSKIAFASARALDGSDALSANFTTNLWLINGDGSGTTSLTRLTGASVRNDRPTWSPDGTRLLFLSSRALDGSDAVNTTCIPWSTQFLRERKNRSANAISEFDNYACP